MNYKRNKNHSRVYKRNPVVEKEKVMTLSAAAAAGILLFAFAKGMFWGYMLKKKLD